MDGVSSKTERECAGSFCQSCGIPFEKPDDFGTNFDNTRNQKYCKFCFKHGRFTEPDITLDGMVEKIVDIMKASGAIPEEEVRKQAKTFLKTLDRWSL